MSFKKIKFIDPVEGLSGKRNKHQKTCFFQGKRYGQRAWGTGERTTPVKTSELEQRSMFSKIAKKVAARLKNDSATYDADLAAFAQAQKNTGVKTFQKWLWQDEMSKL